MRGPWTGQIASPCPFGRGPTPRAASLAKESRRATFRWVLQGLLTVVLGVSPSASFARASAPDDPTPPGSPRDERQTRLVTLDGEHPLALPTEIDRWPQWHERMERQVRVALGLFPEWPKTPLREVIHGRVEREGYTVEKVWFESLPGHFVTGNLYRPTSGAAHYPGILSPHGHWQDGRLYRADDATVHAALSSGAEQHEQSARYPLQARCAQLARMGAVVLHYDMEGYADATQIAHGEGFRDYEAELWAQSAMALQTWNSIRALDFLAALPDVDTLRLGATGASGGGTQTFILAALDQRIQCAVPAVMASTRMQGGCTCENASHLRIGTSNVELCALIAPRALFLIGANDWTVAIEERGLPELRAFYRMLGAGDRVGGICHPEFGHNYNQVSRADMVRFMTRELSFGPADTNDDDGTDEPPGRFDEPALDPIEPAALRVFDADHPRPDWATDTAGVRRWLTQVAKDQQQSWEPDDEEGLTALRGMVGGALRAMLHQDSDPLADVQFTREREWDVDGTRMASGTLAYGDGARIDLTLATPTDWRGPCVLQVLSERPEPRALGGAGTALTAALIESGTAVLSIATLQPDSGRLPRQDSRHDHFVGYTYGYNKTLLAHRATDIVAGLRFARSLADVTSVGLLAQGRAGTWAILAAAVAGSAAPDAIVADYRDAFGEVDGVEHPDFLPGALRWGEMAHYTALLAPTPLWLTGVEEIPTTVSAAYRSAGASDGVQADPADNSGLVGFLRGPVKH